MMLRLRLAAAAICALALLPAQAHASDASVGFSRMTYVCPAQTQISFTWDTATNATFYSLQLVGPLDPNTNGGIAGTYLRQFGTVEVAKGSITSATVSLASSAISSPLSLTWQVMVGGPSGYEGMIPLQQSAVIPIPCLQTTPLTSQP